MESMRTWETIKYIKKEKMMEICIVKNVEKNYRIIQNSVVLVV